MQGILTDNAELKRLILENPNLPLLVFATEEANSGEWYSELASCKCHKGVVLDATNDCWLPNEERVYEDKEDLEEDIRDAINNEERYRVLSDEEFESLVTERTKALDPYWKECIIIKVDAF